MENKIDILYEALLDQILQEKFKPGDKFPSEYELAERYKVNKSTANKAVERLVANEYLIRTRGRGGTIVSSCRHFIKGVIGYRLLLLSAGTYSAQLLKGAQKAASANGYALQYIECEFPEDEHWQEISKMSLKGILFTASSCPPEGFKIPSINVGRNNHGNYIHADYYHGGQLIADFLYNHGHRNVACISNEKRDSMTVCGFFDRMKELGVEGNSCRFIPIAESNLNCAAVWENLALTPAIKAAFCISDAVAMRMLLYLRNINIIVPRDFSICGFGNIKELNSAYPITTINEFPLELGYAACSSLINIIEGKETQPVQMRMPVEMVNPEATVGYLNKVIY